MELEDLKGVGPKTLEALHKLEIYTIDDLINYYPYRYQILKPEKLTNTDMVLTIVGKIENTPKVVYIKRNLNRLTFRFITNEKIINVTLFNRGFLKDQLALGQDLTLTGKYNAKTNSFVASDIRLKKIEDTLIEPKYHLIKEIKNNLFLKLIDEAMKNYEGITDYIPQTLSESYHFLSKDSALKEIHKPTNMQLLKKAQLKFIYEELFIFTFKINYLKYKNSLEHDFLKRTNQKQLIETFINDLPFTLTFDQQAAIDDILQDFIHPKRMNRLILGDVGSGKTIVAFTAMYANYLDNYQSVLMVPTEILAKQHYENIKNLFSKYSLNIKLLIGNMKKSEKQQILEDVKNHKIDILIGTHAVLNEKLEFANLGLVITDEQHRFGVNQRNNLQNKGQKVDVIYLSATPIPRTYALTLYGDMDTSIIKTKPKGRKEVITEIKKESELKEVLFKVLEEIKAGHQVYVVAPSILDSEGMEIENVDSLKEKFTKAFKGIVKIATLHGKQKASDKEIIMQDFANKKYNILISTTVIEVGIDVGNATMMIIFNAERFGLATLHQLRGRVGRSSLTSYCYLISNYEKERLQILKDSNDGFYISQKDFELRGEGDLFGSKQSGDMSFKIANVQRDYKILLQAKKDSDIYLKSLLEGKMSNKFYNEIMKKIDFID